LYFFILCENKGEVLTSWKKKKNTKAERLKIPFWERIYSHDKKLNMIVGYTTKVPLMEKGLQMKNE
jgi:hypothetical protein